MPQPKIYVLTTGDPVRIARIEQFLQGIEFEYVYSASREELAKLQQDFKSNSYKFRQKCLMVGEVGAFHTHISAWDKISKSEQLGIIIEDNVEFTSPASELLKDDILKMIQDCGVLAFNDYSYKPSPDQPFVISSIPEKKPFPVVCYGLAPERAKNLVANASKRGFTVPVDRWLSLPKLCGVYCYVSPKRFTVRASKEKVSSIANAEKGEKTYNPLYMVHWLINRYKYW